MHFPFGVFCLFVFLPLSSVVWQHKLQMKWKLKKLFIGSALIFQCANHQQTIRAIIGRKEARVPESEMWSHVTKPMDVVVFGCLPGLVWEGIMLLMAKSMCCMFDRPAGCMVVCLARHFYWWVEWIIMDFPSNPLLSFAEQTNCANMLQIRVSFSDTTLAIVSGQNTCSIACILGQVFGPSINNSNASVCLSGVRVWQF